MWGQSKSLVQHVPCWQAGQAVMQGHVTEPLFAFANDFGLLFDSPSENDNPDKDSYRDECATRKAERARIAGHAQI